MNRVPKAQPVPDGEWGIPVDDRTFTNSNVRVRAEVRVGYPDPKSASARWTARGLALLAALVEAHPELVAQINAIVIEAEYAFILWRGVDLEHRSSDWRRKRVHPIWRRVLGRKAATVVQGIEGRPSSGLWGV